jgi:3-oxoacyl-[acyl-carrier-protein] synthase I
MPAVVARVAGMGLACPVGLRSRPALAAMDAGITRFVERDDVTHADGSVKASMLGLLDPQQSRAERITWLARHALDEALAGLGHVAGPLPCLLALPARDVGPRIDAGALQRAFADAHTGTGARVQVVVASQRPLEDGRAGVFQALEAALALLALGREPLVLVGGVDSLVDPATLAALAARNRLLGRTNFDGIIPGEGAAFVLLGHPSAVARQHTLALVRGNAVAREPRPFSAAEPIVSTSAGLTSVFRTLLAAVGERVDEVFAATTGEGYFGREFAHAYLRNAALMPEPLRHTPLSSALGDAGAAAGAIALVQAIARLGPHGPGNRAGPGRLCLAYGSSDGGLVGGCVVGRPG